MFSNLFTPSSSSSNVPPQRHRPPRPLSVPAHFPMPANAAASAATATATATASTSRASSASSTASSATSSTSFSAAHHKSRHQTSHPQFYSQSQTPEDVLLRYGGQLAHPQSHPQSQSQAQPTSSHSRSHSHSQSQPSGAGGGLVDPALHRQNVPQLHTFRPPQQPHHNYHHNHHQQQFRPTVKLETTHVRDSPAELNIPPNPSQQQQQHSQTTCDDPISATTRTDATAELTPLSSQVNANPASAPEAEAAAAAAAAAAASLYENGSQTPELEDPETNVNVNMNVDPNSTANGMDTLGPADFGIVGLSMGMAGMAGMGMGMNMHMMQQQQQQQQLQAQHPQQQQQYNPHHGLPFNAPVPVPAAPASTATVTTLDSSSTTGYPRGASAAAGGGSGAGPSRKKRATTSTAANDTELRRLLREYDGFTLQQMAQEVQRHDGSGGKAEKVKQVFAMLWLREHCRKDTGSVRRDRVYCAYADRCGTERVSVLNPASFGKLVRIIFPNVQTRRLGVRGESKYHYVDLMLSEPLPQQQGQQQQMQPRRQSGEAVGGHARSASFAGGRRLFEEESARRRGSSVSMSMSAQAEGERRQSLHKKSKSTTDTDRDAFTQASPNPNAGAPEGSQVTFAQNNSQRHFPYVSGSDCFCGRPTLPAPEPWALDPSPRHDPLAKEAQAMIDRMLHFDPTPSSASLSMSSTETPDQPTEPDDALQLPNIHVHLSPGTDTDAADALFALYRSHCISVIDNFRYCKEKNLLRHFSALAGTLTVPVHKLFVCPPLAPWIQQCDWLMYQKMLAFVAPLTTQVVPDPVLSAFANIATSLVPHIRATLRSHPEHVARARLVPALVFCHLLKRFLDVNHAANAAAAWLCHRDNRAKMWEEFRACVDGGEVVARAKVPPCSRESARVLVEKGARALLLPLDDNDANGLNAGGVIAGTDGDGDGLGLLNGMSLPPPDPEESPFPDRWTAFIAQLPALFPGHPPQCILDKVEGTWSAILHRLTLAGAQSFSAWWMAKVFFVEMSAWSAEKGGFMRHGSGEWGSAAVGQKAGVEQVPQSASELQNAIGGGNENDNGAAEGLTDSVPVPADAGADAVDGITDAMPDLTQGHTHPQPQKTAIATTTTTTAAHDDSAIDLGDESVYNGAAGGNANNNSATAEGNEDEGSGSGSSSSSSSAKYTDMIASHQTDADGDVLVAV